MKHLIVCSLLICLSLLLVKGNSFSSTHDTNSEVILKTTTLDPLQILFQIGVDELKKGNTVSAIDIFEALAKKTDSPRVQLELARALFLDRRFREAEEVFLAVLQQPDLPWPVQENIRQYLEEIDSYLGFFKFRFSLVSDSNPRNFTDSRQILIGGQPLTIIPPEDNKEIIGVRYSVRGARAFTQTGSLMGYLNASYSDFEGSQFDRWSADAGLLLSFRSLPRLKLRGGVEESYYANEHLYEFPYIGFIFTPQPAYQLRMNNELKVGQLRVPNAGYLDATNLSLTTKAKIQLTSKTDTYGDIYLEKSIAGEKAYSYYGGALGLGLSFSPLQGWDFRPSVSVGRRLYEADDPFWGETRRDTRKIAGITFKNSNLKVFGYTPEVRVSYEDNTSNIDYFSFDKIEMAVDFY